MCFRSEFIQPKNRIFARRPVLVTHNSLSGGEGKRTTGGMGTEQGGVGSSILSRSKRYSNRLPLFEKRFCSSVARACPSYSIRVIFFSLIFPLSLSLRDICTSHSDALTKRRARVPPQCLCVCRGFLYWSTPHIDRWMMR